MLQFKFPAMHSAFQQVRRRVLRRSVVGCASIFGHKQNNGLQDSACAGCSFGEETDVRSQQVSCSHDWKERWSRSDFLEWGGGTLVGLTRFVVVVLAAVLTPAAAFFLGFPAAGLGAAEGLCSGFSDLPVFLVAVTLGYACGSVTS